jgi:hypothetical protein
MAGTRLADATLRPFRALGHIGSFLRSKTTGERLIAFAGLVIAELAVVLGAAAAHAKLPPWAWGVMLVGLVVAGTGVVWPPVTPPAETPPPGTSPTVEQHPVPPPPTWVTEGEVTRAEQELDTRNDQLGADPERGGGQ